MAVTFTRKSPGTHVPSTGAWTGASSSTITASAIQVRGNATRYRELGLSLSTMPTLLVTPSTYPLKAGTTEFIQPGDQVVWNELAYVVKDVDPVAPDGYVIVARVVVGAA